MGNIVDIIKQTSQGRELERLGLVEVINVVRYVTDYYNQSPIDKDKIDSKFNDYYRPNLLKRR